MKQNQSDQTSSRELTRRYLAIQRRIQNIRNSLVLLVEECVEFHTIFTSVTEDNKNRLGWWLKNHAPAIDHKEVKKLLSLASRTHNTSLIQSWQLRLLGIVSPIHHKDKPLMGVTREAQRRHKDKSWLFYVSKGQEVLTKQIDRMGGLNALTKDEQQQLVDQFGPLAAILKRLK